MPENQVFGRAGGDKNFVLNVSLNFIISTLVPIMAAIILKKNKAV